MFHFLNLWRESFAQDDMPDWKPPQFSKRQVSDAGKLLKEHHPAVSDQLLEAFRIAHNWRASHIVPMRAMRAEMNAKVRRVGGDALTAARLKRMSSLRAKLRRAPHTLYQMQDIAGCRAIMPDQAAIDRLLALYRSEAAHHLQGENDYISRPKASGYRSHHLIFRFQGVAEYEPWNRSPMFVEVQLRTRLQHAWATAVEAVGMVRGEDLKSGVGDADWLRFFSLMAAEIAAREKSALVPGTPESDADRREEIVALERGLNALASLEKYRQAVKISETASTGSPFFLIQFDPVNQYVRVRGVSLNASSHALDDAENNKLLNSVLVSVDKIADLRSAYPNYFMDVRMFTDCLRRVVSPPPKAKFNIDEKWLSAWLGRG
ncbi:MAG TPA: RelA/SpoT domain-containing protein [Sphingomonas sp.]|nr:RelA/SpoT domain-containing protein [Sphingomonas sp.]